MSILDLSNEKNSIKRHFGNEESESEEGKPLNSNTWASNEKFFSSFKDNFFDTEFSGGSFGDWKSRIEDRSNRVLQGYDSHNYENTKYSTGEAHTFLYHCLSTLKRPGYIKCIIMVICISCFIHWQKQEK